ncbi:LacI family DNA-binding transcriptional regulator [Cellulomonas sp. ICMP 17802]|uniref:LacI family DNA-binding transcriptional regulator n=1 Tax=Cellulomonas sp. ICMP 17802 TaxID=3239199 RepID=UPI00351B9B2B
MGQRVTITDVARRAGVSTATVSKVINERYGVASRTTSHVQAVIEELGYESSLVARSLRSHKTNVIGILVAEFEPFSAEILKGASIGLGDSGYALLAYTGGQLTGGVGWERRYLSRLSGTLIDGAVLVTPTVLEADAGIPVVAIDPHAGPSGLPTVDSDNFTGAVQAVEHLLGLGHRRIGFIGGRSDLESSRLREAGYRKALADAGIEVDPGLMREGDYRKDSTHEPARELLTLPERPTAIFAANDLSAIGTLEIAQELGLDVPAELSIIGFDDIPESALTNPPLSTVHQPIQQMGAAAIALLIALMDGAPVDRTHIQLVTSLVERGSTAPPR